MPDVFSKENVPSYQRVDGHMIDPREIRLDPELSGRIEPPSDDDIRIRIEDFLNPKVGQLNSVLIAKGDDGFPILIDGHIRWMAAIKITEQKLGPHKDAQGNSGVFKLNCKYFVGTKAERFVATIKANVRKPTSLADDGYNISRLIHNFQMSEEDIARDVYGRVTVDGKPDVAWVRERMAYADLVPEAREALKSGALKVTQIATLAKMSKNAQRDRLKAAKENGGKVTSAILKGGPVAPVNGNGNGHKKPTWKVYSSGFKPYCSLTVETPMARYARSLEAYEATGDFDAHFAVVKELVGER